MSTSLLRDDYVLLFLIWRGRCCRFAVKLPLIDVPLSRCGGTRAQQSGLTSVSAYAVRESENCTVVTQDAESSQA